MDFIFGIIFNKTGIVIYSLNFFLVCFFFNYALSVKTRYLSFIVFTIDIFFQAFE